MPLTADQDKPTAEDLLHRLITGRERLTKPGDGQRLIAEYRDQVLAEGIGAIRAAAGPYPEGNWQEGDSPDPTQVGMHDAAAVLAGLMAASRPSGDRRP